MIYTVILRCGSKCGNSMPESKYTVSQHSTWFFQYSVEKLVEIAKLNAFKGSLVTEDKLSSRGQVTQGTLFNHNEMIHNEMIQVKAQK